MISRLKIFISIVFILAAINMQMFTKHFIRNAESKQKELSKILESENQHNKDLISQQSKLLIKERIIKEAEEKLAFVKCTENDSKIVNIYDFQENNKNHQFVLLDIFTSTAEAKTH